MHRTTLVLLLGAAMLTLAIAGCGGGDDDDDGGAAEPTPTETETAGGGAVGEVATLVQDKEPGDFFQATCSTCHGVDRAGITGLGLPLLPDALTKENDFYFDTIKNGRAGTVMPAWGQQGLTDPEIRAMLAFIRTAP
jgi:cytochrome c5